MFNFSSSYFLFSVRAEAPATTLLLWNQWTLEEGVGIWKPRTWGSRWHNCPQSHLCTALGDWAPAWGWHAWRQSCCSNFGNLFKGASKARLLHEVAPQNSDAGFRARGSGRRVQSQCSLLADHPFAISWFISLDCSTFLGAQRCFSLLALHQFLFHEYFPHAPGKTE